jgi:hypothetical protein
MKFFSNVKDIDSLKQVFLRSMVNPDYRIQKAERIHQSAGMTFIFLIMIYNVLLLLKISNMRNG